MIRFRQFELFPRNRCSQEIAFEGVTDEILGGSGVYRLDAVQTRHQTWNRPLTDYPIHALQVIYRLDLQAELYPLKEGAPILHCFQ